MNNASLTKLQIIDLLRGFVRQRPGFDYGNYGDLASYRSDARQAQKYLRIARELLSLIELDARIDAKHLINAMSDRQRLTLNGRRLHYTAGQYWSIEYRHAVCRMCFYLLWDACLFDSDDADASPRQRVEQYLRRHTSPVTINWAARA